MNISGVHKNEWKRYFTPGSIYFNTDMEAVLSIFSDSPHVTVEDRCNIAFRGKSISQQVHLAYTSMLTLLSPTWLDFELGLATQTRKGVPPAYRHVNKECNTQLLVHKSPVIFHNLTFLSSVTTTLTPDLK